MRSVKVKGIKRTLVTLVAIFLFTVPNTNRSFAVDVNNWNDFQSNVSSGQNVNITGPITQTGSPPIPSATVGNGQTVTINGGENTITGYSNNSTGETAGNSMIEVEQGGTLNINEGVYTGSYGPNGGVLNNSGTTTITGSQFTNSNAAVADTGGANDGNGGAILSILLQQILVVLFIMQLMVL